MPLFRKDPSIRQRAQLLLESHWRPKAVAADACLMRRHFETFRHVFQNDFEGFLKHAIDVSGYNRFAIEHFKQSTAGYIFDGEIKAFKRDLEHLTMKITE